MHHPNDPDVSWWPVHRVTGHHGLTVQTWQRLTLDGGWGAVSTAQARPTRLRGQPLHWPGSAELQCEPEPAHGISSLHPAHGNTRGHTLASHWSVTTNTGLSLAGDDLSRATDVHQVCLAGVACHLSVTKMLCHTHTYVTHIGGWLWRFVTATSLSRVMTSHPAASVTTTLTPDVDHYKLSCGSHYLAEATRPSVQC